MYDLASIIARQLILSVDRLALEDEPPFFFERSVAAADDTEGGGED
jgi:hypothetical protein